MARSQGAVVVPAVFSRSFLFQNRWKESRWRSKLTRKRERKREKESEASMVASSIECFFSVLGKREDCC